MKMAQVSISEAAKLAGKNRTTIYKYINSGRLSAVVSVDGVKKIDISELLRVFPDCKIDKKQQQGDNVTQQLATDEINRLQQEIQHLKALMQAQQKLLDEKTERNNDLKQALLLLESKSPEKSAKRNFWIFGKKS